MRNEAGPYLTATERDSTEMTISRYRDYEYLKRRHGALERLKRIPRSQNPSSRDNRVRRMDYRFVATLSLQLWKVSHSPFEECSNCG